MSNEKSGMDLSEFLRYLSRYQDDGGRLPALSKLSKELKISVATLREQLEVARALGLVDVKPKTGIRKLDYTFRPAVIKSLSYAAALEPGYFFHAFSDLRTHIESAYWYQAVQLLTGEDQAELSSLIERANVKLEGSPIQIPHSEHRELHLLIYRRLDNPFVTGILESYWEAYEAVGLDLYTDISYLQTVWTYHRRMVEAICTGNSSDGYNALMEHTDLLQQRSKTVSRSKFE
jgi:DNA-binding FadR family transcriptional regulator